jgi:hypothetical protein
MDMLVSYDKEVMLVANPPTLAPCPNFTNLRSLRLHIQQALQRLINPQSNVLGWSGLVMSRPMFALLSRSLFCVPTNPGPIPVYNGPGTPIVNADGSPVVNALGNPMFQADPVIDRATQATINAQFVQARNYWLSYQNIKRACYNMLNANINDAF